MRFFSFSFVIIQAATHKVKENNQACREMYLLNVEVVVVGFLKQQIAKDKIDLNKELQPSQRPQFINDLM